MNEASVAYYPPCLFDAPIVPYTIHLTLQCKKYIKYAFKNLKLVTMSKFLVVLHHLQKEQKFSDQK